MKASILYAKLFFSLVGAISMSACTSADPTMGAGSLSPQVSIVQPPAGIGSSAAQGTLATMPVGSSARTDGGSETAAYAAVPSLAAIGVAPAVGLPSGPAQALWSEMSRRGGQTGLRVASASTPGNEHSLKGYFSALNDGSRTTVVYVWDVLDGSGARQHRITGQESLSSSSPNAWQSVDAATMQRIADRTLQNYLAWRSSRQG